MKYVRLTALLGVLPLLLLLLTGCAKEETAEHQDEAQGITLALTIPASESALTRATTVPLAGENILSNVYVLFYSKTGANTVLPSYFYSETNINKEEEWVYNIPIAHLKRDLLNGVRYEVYVVASLPAGTTAPDKSTAKNVLLGMFETQFDRNAAPLMSFSGKGEVTYAPNVSSTVEIPLRRTVARLDITLQGLKAGQTAELQLIQSSTTPYFENERIATIKLKTDILTADVDGLYRAYVYENYPSYETDEKTKLVLMLKNTDGSTPTIFKPIEVNKGTIIRNTIYTYNIDVTPDPITIGRFGGWDETAQEYTKDLQVDTETYRADPLLAWEPPTYVLTNAVNRHSGTANVDILKALGADLTNYPAAQHCVKKGNGWYLPSQAQLMAMWVISEGLPTKFKLASTTEPYWSSTESTNHDCWTVSFKEGHTINNGEKDLLVNRVRCVRDVTP